MTDYQNSHIPDLLEIVGTQHPIYIVGNKIDLLPKDSKGYLNHMLQQLRNYSEQVGSLPTIISLPAPVLSESLFERLPLPNRVHQQGTFFNQVIL